LLLTDIDRLACVLVATQLALLVTSFEAIGTGGSDNLIVPLGTYYLLVKLTPTTVENISVQLLAQLVILLGVLLVARTERFLTFSGAIAAHLVLYAAFSLGGPPWFVAPMLALAAAIALENTTRRAVRRTKRGYDVRVIFYVSIVSVLLIFADNTFATLIPGPTGLRTGHPFHALFVGGLAAPLAIMAYWAMESIPRVRKRSRFHRGLASASLGYAVVAPLGLWILLRDRGGVEFATAALVCVGGMLAYLALRRITKTERRTSGDFRLLALGVFIATIIVIPLHLYLIGVTDWSLR